MNNDDLANEEKEIKVSKLKVSTVYELPTAEKWYPGYNLIESILILSRNENYRSLLAHVNAINYILKRKGGKFMKKYFNYKSNVLQEDTGIDLEIIDSFWTKVIFELDKMGASEEDKNLLQDMMIYNAIKSNRLPEDVAWAILQ